MPFTFLTKLFGSRNDRLLKQYRATVVRINAMEAGYEGLSDDALKAKTTEFKARVAAGESLDAMLPEAFAVVREGSKRVMKMRHFDVQLLGGMSLHHGKISEMGTGEGKTLTATLPVYLNALTGKGVHVVTVNDYLASRDARWMGQLYEFLGLTVGINTPNVPREEKQAAYSADITNYQFRLFATICHLQGAEGRFKTSVAELERWDPADADAESQPPATASPPPPR